MAARPTVVFAFAHAGYYRNFETAIRLLCAAGINVRVHCSKEHARISERDYELPHGLPGSVEFTATQESYASAYLLEFFRLLRDVLLYSRPEYRDASDLQQRFYELQKRGVIAERLLRNLQRFCAARGATFRSTADRVLAFFDRHISTSRAAKRAIERLAPDLLVVTPLVNFSSREVDLVKAARKRGIPTLLAVASWDNLTNKGLIKIQPDQVAVWNRHMAREATEIHGVPAANVSIVGAPVFDDWFSRKPSRCLAEFCERLGLNPKRPIIVYLCSSRSIAGRAEYSIVKAWAKSIRNSEEPVVRKANLLVRPHPMELTGWSKLREDKNTDRITLSSATVWPINARYPVSEEHRADFYDTLYHADAIVGLNTSAMIEAAILRKPVLTFFDHAASHGQIKNLHFRYLAESGYVLQAESMAEHVEQLCCVLGGVERRPLACDHFVKDFVRPLGRDLSSSAILANKILKMINGDNGRELQTREADQPLRNAPAPIAMATRIDV